MRQILLLAAFFCAVPGFQSRVLAQTFTRIDTNVIARAGGYTQGSSWGDYDNDGDEDLFLANGSRSNASNTNFLFRNEGKGVFVRITSGAIVNDIAAYTASCWGDYDNDGDLDIFAPTMGGTNNVLYRNDGNGNFTRITTGVVANDGGDGLGSSWADFDNDGDLDLYVANDSDEKDFLYRNNSNGTFTKITEGPLVNDAYSTLTGSWADYDNDNDFDLLVINIFANVRLYANNGNGTFNYHSTSNLDNLGLFSTGASWGDYDNDGDLDVMITANDGVRNLLYRNKGDGTFELATTGDFATNGGRTGGSTWGDFDNDGDLDLFINNRTGNNLLYNNDGRGNFAKITSGTIVNESGGPCSSSDYDNDGDLDLLLASAPGGPPFEDYLYSNNGNNNSWIKIKCIGTVSNKTGIGARVRAKASINGKPVWQMREIAQQTGYGCHNSLIVHFGLGDATKIDSLVIRWPSKKIDVYTNVTVKQFLTAIEGQPTTVVSEQTNNLPQAFSLSQNYPNPFNPATTIAYHLPRASQVKLRVYNLAGQLLRTLVDAPQAAGRFQINWDGKDDVGNGVASGVYLYRLEAGSFAETKKMILMR